MNLGGFSWKRLFGISALKSRVSRKIGIPLTASGRRRKLGASIFKAVGPVAGTIAVASIEAAKQTHRPNPPSKQGPAKGVYFCQVKGITYNNDDGTSRLEAIKQCSIGDAVKLVSDPQNPHDKNAIRVLLASGQQIGYISARQAARLAGNVHMLTAKVHSRVTDEWGNDTVKLRIVTTGPVHEVHSDSRTSAIQAEARKTAQREGWQSTLIYFEDAEHGLYQVVQAENTEHMNQTLQEGLAQVGFIGLNDAPKGIKFGFVLNDGLPVNGPIAQRFLGNAREWITIRSKEICTQDGVAAPVVHDFEPSKECLQQAGAQKGASKPIDSKAGTLLLTTIVVLGIGGIVLGLLTDHWLAFGILFAIVFAMVVARRAGK